MPRFACRADEAGRARVQWPVNAATFLLAALAVSVAAVAQAQTQTHAQPAVDCRPPAYVERAIHGAERIDLVRLGPPGECAIDPLEPNHDPACFAGFKRADWFRLPPEGVEKGSRMLSGKNLACSPSGKGSGPAYVVGFDVAGGGGPVRVTLRMPTGEVEFEIPNGKHFAAALSPSGLREWRRLLAAVAPTQGRTPEEFERGLTRDAGQAPVAAPAPAAAVPDTASGRAGAHAQHGGNPDKRAR